MTASQYLQAKALIEPEEEILLSGQYVAQLITGFAAIQTEEKDRQIKELKEENLQFKGKIMQRYAETHDMKFKEYFGIVSVMSEEEYNISEAGKILDRNDL